MLRVLKCVYNDVMSKYTFMRQVYSYTNTYLVFSKYSQHITYVIEFLTKILIHSLNDFTATSVVMKRVIMDLIQLH